MEREGGRGSVPGLGSPFFPSALCHCPQIHWNWTDSPTEAPSLRPSGGECWRLCVESAEYVTLRDVSVPTLWGALDLRLHASSGKTNHELPLELCVLVIPSRVAPLHSHSGGRAAALSLPPQRRVIETAAGVDFTACPIFRRNPRW